MKGVNLEIRSGEIFGLLGPNGAGKTTLISLIVGLAAPSEGDVRLSSKRRPSLVPQDFAFYPMLTGHENLSFFGGMLGLRGTRLRQRMDYAIEFTGLRQVLNQRAGNYSGGIKRRLNLAIGLMPETELLLLDEPTVGVDPQSRAFILDAIRGLRTQGVTVIYTSHYMEEVEYLCDRVAILDHGRVLSCGALDQLLAGDAKLRLSFANDVSSDFLKDLEREFGATATDARTAELRTPLARPLSEIARRCEAHGVEIMRAQHGAKNLEEVFMALTHRSLRD